MASSSATSIETGLMDQSHPVKNGNVDRDQCNLHQKVYRLFCLNCSAAICGACMDVGVHDLHQVSNLAIVYREKFSNVESKLIRAEKHNDELRPGTTVYQRNLEMLEKEESFVRKEIESIARVSQLEVSSMTSDRKKTLKKKLEVSVINTRRLMDLRGKIEQLTANEFMQKYPEIDGECDDLIDAPQEQAQEVVTLPTVDIECGLIPPYQFQRVVYQGFLKAKIDHSEVFVMKSAHDVEWELTVSKSAMVQIRPITSDRQLMMFRHMLIVIIPHPDYTKEIHQTFEPDLLDNVFDVVQTSHIAQQGFCNATGDLVMKIGIRPLNAIAEKHLLVYHHEQQKNAIEILTRQLQPISDTYDYNHLTMYFNPKPSELQTSKKLYSYQLKDDVDRHWSLTVKLNTDDFVEAYVQLFRGSATDCDYFVELRHFNPEKTVVKKSKGRHFDASRNLSMWGFKMIQWTQLNNDAGFHLDGRLHFRFGVHPLPKCSGFGAANA